MSTSRQRLSYLFNCYYHKTATPKERDELFSIIAAGTSDEELSALIHQCWDELHFDEPLFSASKTDAMLNSVADLKKQTVYRDKTGVISLWKKLTIAALALFFVGFGVHQYLQTNNKAAVDKVTKVKVQPLHDALPGTNKAVLTLANGKTIILDNAQNGTLAKQGTTTVKKTNNGRLVYNAADLSKGNSAIAINTITTPRGGQYQITLPDGTQVWLNSVSSLRFPTRFTGSYRQVEITGEAYFEVAKNAAMPFRVKTAKAQIEVLGTHFNVMAYDDEHLMKTTLLEGAVNIKSGSAVNRLKPGQQAQIDKGGATKIVNNVDVEDETAWKNGLFQFNEVGIETILRQASRWYDLDVVYTGKIPNREFTGRISRNVKASALLDILRYFDVDVKIEGKNIVVH
jgi:transmembrane sensor